MECVCKEIYNNAYIEDEYSDFYDCCWQYNRYVYGGKDNVNELEHDCLCNEDYGGSLECKILNLCSTHECSCENNYNNCMAKYEDHNCICAIDDSKCKSTNGHACICGVDRQYSKCTRTNQLIKCPCICASKELENYLIKDVIPIISSFTQCVPCLK